MATNPLQSKLLELFEARQAEQEAYATYEALRDRKEAIKLEVAAILKDLGMKSAKTDEGFTVAIRPKKSLVVTDFDKVSGWIHDNKLQEELYLSVNKSAFTPIVNQALKANGEVVPGVEFELGEYISLSVPKEAKDGK